jgi:MFS family permease
MDSVQNAFKHNKARKNVIVGGLVILIAITALSCVSSFMIYRLGFGDMPFVFQQALAVFAVIVVEGGFIWTLYGFTRAFSSWMERLVSLVGMGLLVVVMLINLITHFMMVKGIELHPFQQDWIDWGAVSVFIAVLLIVLLVTLADPVIRLLRLELRYLGKQQEKILEAKTEALDSEKIQTAMIGRANFEAEALADKILGAAAPVEPGIGFTTAVERPRLRGEADPKDRGEG